MSFFSRHILGSVHVLLQQAIVLRFANKQYTLKKLIVSTLFIRILSVILENIISSLSYAGFFLRIVMQLVTYKFIFTQTFVNSILLSIGQFILTIAIEYLGYPILQLSSHIFNLELYDTTNIIILRVFNIFFLSFIYWILPKLKHYLSHGIANSRVAVWIIYLIFLILFSCPNIYFQEINHSGVQTGIEIYNNLLFIIFFVYSLICANSLMKIANIKQQLEMQQIYTETLESTSMQLRAFKHEYGNIMNTIGGMVYKKDLSGLEQLEKELTVEFQSINNTSTIDAAFRHIPLLYGILLTKSSVAELNNIEFRITIPCELELYYCTSIDFSKMIGILLDNAYDAAKESDKKQMSLSILEQHDVYTIIIKNTYAGVVDKNLIFTDGYTSKEGHSGLGLHAVDRIVSKYKKMGYAMDLKIKCQDEVFTAVLTV